MIFLPFRVHVKSGGGKIDKSIHKKVGPYVLFSYPEKIRGLSRKTREEIDFEKKKQKFWFEIINISRNPKNHVFGPKMVSFVPRTPKFRILVTNYGTKDIILEFLKNLQKWPFLSFGSVFGVFAKTRAAGPPVTRFCSNLHQNFSFFMQFLDMPKNAKIGPKKISGWPPPLKRFFRAWNADLGYSQSKANLRGNF